MCMHVLSSLWCVLIRTQLVQFLKGLGKLKLSHWQPCPCQSAANRTGPKQAPLVWMINYIPRYSVSVITYPCLRYLLLAPRFSATHLAACIMHTFIFLKRLPHSQMHTISRGHGMKFRLSTLQWRHMSVMASQITGNSTVCSTVSVCSG